MQKEKEVTQDKEKRESPEKAGTLPELGQLLRLNGLVYQVRFVNRRTGELRLKLMQPAQLSTIAGMQLKEKQDE